MPIKTEDLTQMQFVISKGVKVILKYQALSAGVSTSELIRDALQEYFDKREVKVDMNEGIGTWGAGAKDSD